MRDRFGVPGQTRSAYQDDLTGFRTMLAGAPDNSVKIIGIGAMVSLSRLLNSPADALSPLTGMQLVAAKVRDLNQIAGTFPNSNGTLEYNVTRDIASSQNVYANWPTPIICHGGEVGGTVQTGPRNFVDPMLNPMKHAFEVYAAVNPADVTPVFHPAGTRGLS